MGNCLKGRCIRSGMRVVIPLSNAQVVLACDKDPLSMNDSWDRMCKSLIAGGFPDPRGNMHIDFICINGVDRSFH
jgi:hypothetical protein